MVVGLRKAIETGDMNMLPITWPADKCYVETGRRPQQVYSSDQVLIFLSFQEYCLEHRAKVKRRRRMSSQNMKSKKMLRKLSEPGFAGMYIQSTVAFERMYSNNYLNDLFEFFTK